LIAVGAKVNKKLPEYIMYNNYKQLLDILGKNGADLSIKSNQILIFITGILYDDLSLIDVVIDLGLTMSRQEAIKEVSKWDYTIPENDSTLIYYLERKKSN
jgi:hypothetical protein